MNEKLSIEAMVLGALAARTNGILELNFSETLNVKGVIIAIEKDKIIIKGTYHDQQLFRLLQGFDSTRKVNKPKHERIRKQKQNL